MSQEQRDKISCANKGKPKPIRSDEHCKNLSKSLMGKLKSLFSIPKGRVLSSSIS
jgi:hypothetical protein